jgi:hypothetical protein
VLIYKVQRLDEVDEGPSNIADLDVRTSG